MALARHYKVSEIKQKLLHPAQTSVYSVEITTNDAVNKFLGATSIGTNQEAFNLSCCEASLPGSSLATHEASNDYHGSTEKMVYRRIYDDTIDLTFYVDYTYLTLKYFLGWMSFIVGEGSYFNQDDFLLPSTFHRMTYPEKYKTNIRILKFEKDISPTSKKYALGYDFVGAFPINLTSIPVSYDQSDLLKVTVSFSYQRYVIKNQYSPYRSSGTLSAPGNFPAPDAPSNSPAAQAQSNSNIFGSLDVYNATTNLNTSFTNVAVESYSNAWGPNSNLDFGYNNGPSLASFYSTSQNLSSNPFGSGVSPADAQAAAKAERDLINSQNQGNSTFTFTQY